MRASTHAHTYQTYTNNNTKDKQDMPLGKVDFGGVQDFAAVPAGQYDGQTDSWESKPTKNGDSLNIIGKFSYTDNDGNSRKFTKYWNLKPTALWSLKRDLIALGIDKEEFSRIETDAKGNPVMDENGRPKILPVDLEGIFSSLFNPQNPVPVTLTFSVKNIPSDRDDADSPPREVNQLEKVELAY